MRIAAFQASSLKMKTRSPLGGLVMPKRLNLVLLVAAAGLSTSCAPTEQQAASDPRSGHDCFNVADVTGFESVDTDTVKLHVGVGDEYEVDLEGGQCNDVDWTQKLALESTPSSWLCTGKDPAQGNIYFRNPVTRHRVQCYIKDVRRVVVAKPST
jgi:hypothetical protein